MNISLDEKDFRDLVSGEIIKKGNIKIALQDIGYTLMLDIIAGKMDELNSRQR